MTAPIDTAVLRDRLLAHAERMVGVQGALNTSDILRLAASELYALFEKLVDAEVALSGETAQREHFTAYGVTHNGRLLYCSSDMRDAYSEQRVELDAARARIAELEKDAGRYAWLRKSAMHISWNDWVSYSPGYTLSDAWLMDAAIDVASARDGEER